MSQVHMHSENREGNRVKSTDLKRNSGTEKVFLSLRLRFRAWPPGGGQAGLCWDLIQTVGGIHQLYGKKRVIFNPDRFAARLIPTEGKLDRFIRFTRPSFSFGSSRRR